MNPEREFAFLEESYASLFQILDSDETSTTELKRTEYLKHIKGQQPAAYHRIYSLINKSLFAQQTLPTYVMKNNLISVF